MTAAAYWVMFRGSDSFVKTCWRAVKTPPLLRPFPTTSGLCDKKCRGTVLAARGRRMMSTQGLPHSEGVGGQSDYHVDITVREGSWEKWQSIPPFFSPLSIERLAVWSSFRGSAASSCCVFLSPVEQVNGLTREEGKSWRSAYLGRYKQGF